MNSSLQETLRQHVEQLAAVPRPPGTREHVQARAYVRRHLEAAGFTVAEQTSEFEPGIDGINLLTAPEPNDPRLPLLIIGAHYDSTPTTPGADDNASAVAALLELAHSVRPLLTKPLKARLQLAAYDLEEYGLIGSEAHARQLRDANTTLLGMVSLEMLGYCDHRPGSQRLPAKLRGIYPDIANFIGVVGNQRGAQLMQRFAQAMQRVPNLPVESMAVPGDGHALPESRLSDHRSFWDVGYPALMLTDTSFFRNPHYHQASDRPATLDYDFLTKVTQGVCEAVADLLQG